MHLKQMINAPKFKLLQHIYLYNLFLPSKHQNIIVYDKHS